MTTENGTYEKSIDLTGKTLKFESGIISKFTVNGFAKKEAPASWIATDLADITAADEVVITMAKGESVYALSAETDAKSNNPQAVLVTVKNGELTAAPADNLVWNIANDKGNLTIYPNGQTDKWLFAVSGDTKVKVGNSATNKIFTLDATTKYLKNTGANRYLGVYIDKADWRAYANTSNIAGQTLCFYVKGTPKTALETPANLQVSAEKVVSWDAVSGAASYNVTIGTETYTSNTNSYDAAAIADDYYDVAVVAVPSDKENYKNSAAATLTGVKFGTPTLATPTLKEGVIDGASISVSWSVDERATAGYNCELFKGGVKVGESKTVNAGAVTFTGLDAETAYVVKVNAIAVEGEKAYAASPVATLDVTTKAAGSAAAKTYTLTFANSFNDKNVQNYTTTWEATRDGFTWKMVNWNNNNNYNNDWAYVKAGPKGNTNAHAKIETAAAIPEAISKISITIDEVKNGSITSIVLKSSTTNDFTAGTTIETKSAVAAGEVVFTIPSPQNNLHYQLDFTLNNTTPNSKKGTNGVATVSKVVYTNN